MKKIISTSQLTDYIHPALGPVYKLTFTDNTTVLVYAETFLDQVEGWKPKDDLKDFMIDLNEAFIHTEPSVI